MEDLEFLFRRTNALYRENKNIWERSQAAYRGGEHYLDLALIRHVSEIDLEFAERRKRAYYFNYPRKLAGLITQCVFSAGPQREHVNLKVAEDFSRTGLRVDEVMRQISTLLNIYGAAAMIVEMPFFCGEVDAERKQKERLRPAVQALSPLQVPDWGIGSDGELEWLITEEHVTLDRGPLRPPLRTVRRKLFTRSEFVIYERIPETGRIVEVSRAEHNLGSVPALYLAEPEGFGLQGGHYFEDVVRISDAILNNESEAQMNVVKQMFGLLVISEGFARGVRPREMSSAQGGQEKFSHVLARSAAIWESPEERGISRYISPSGADTALIRSENQALKEELFDTIGMSLASCRQAQTAEAKAWDFHRVQQFLCGRADLLEQSELRCWELMAGMDHSITVPKISYSREFAVTDLQSSVASLTELKRFSGGSEYRREVARAALSLLEKIKRIDPERRKKILGEIESWQNRNTEAENV
jgi:hypothetical protein